MGLNDRQRNVLLHMTGLSRSKNQYRNHFAAGEGHDDWETLQSLVALGILHPGRKSGELWGGMTFFHATEAGIEEAERLAKEKDS